MPPASCVCGHGTECPGASGDGCPVETLVEDLRDHLQADDGDVDAIWHSWS